MKIIIAPDSFKGSLSSIAVADAVERGIKAVDSSIEVLKIPMADGGEGTVESLINYSGGEIVHLDVSGPLGDKISAYYGLLGDGKTAIMEMAKASGLPLISEKKRNPLKTTTFGTGELIRDALDKGCKKIIIGIGGLEWHRLWEPNFTTRTLVRLQRK
jgi:glycerate kinase